MSEIPDAAVAAAAKAWLASSRTDVTLGALKDILRAAAPHMLAGAWDDGHAAGHLDYYADEEAESNPHR